MDPMTIEDMEAASDMLARMVAQRDETIEALVGKIRRMRAQYANLHDATLSLLNVEGAAMAGAQCGAFQGLDVARHFNKARTMLAREGL